MNVVGKVGSLITQGVYSVATPFHPFGGAVDIIVVQQQDGTFRSTPWYVQFGKFQGVLKGAEKVVRINVNGVEANFHMYLDNSGEAYFVREAESVQGSENSRVSADEKEGALEHSLSIDNSQCNVSNDNVENFRLQSTLSDPGVLRDDYSSFRPDQLDRNDSDVCRFYDFQDDQSLEGELSPEYGSGRFDNLDGVDNFVEAQGSDSEMVLVSVDGHILTAPITSSEQNTENVQLVTPQFHLGPGEGNGFCEGDSEFTVTESAWNPGYITDLDASSSKSVAVDASCENGNDQVGTDDIHASGSCKDDGECALKASEDDLGNDSKGDAYRDVCIPDTPGKEHTVNVDEDHVAEDMDNFENREEEVHVHQEHDCLPIDADDLSPSANNDKFRSCLDLTMSGIDETTEADDSTVKVREVPISLEEKPSLCDESSSHSGNENRPTLAYSDEGSVTGIHIAVGKTNDDDLSPSNVLPSRATESLRIVGIEDTYPESPSSGDVSVYKDDRASPVMSHETAKSSAGGDFLETESVRSEALDGQYRSSFEQERVQANDGDFTETESTRSEVPYPHVRKSSEQEHANYNPLVEISLCGHLLKPGMGLEAANEAFNSHRISEEEFRSTAATVAKNENLVIRYKEKYFLWAQAAHIVLGITAFGVDLSVESKDAIQVEQEVAPKPEETDPGSASGRRWRLWPIPFRRVKTIQSSNSSSVEEVFVDSESVSHNPSIQLTPTSMNGTPTSTTGSKSPLKRIVRTNIPTNQQIESLNLKEGQNDVTFSFSTRVLGLQQVQAHIYLWKWNARIVISDVDGTITKSDVLGQFMPLVGKDWSQSGVARLFSAIKENGYQLLFLSARAIVQAYLTKSFLFNLKQDGKTLPNGPVVISPNGLFPSLFREVIRRAPHEFKIACLEDIKALFPPDYNPFYAGFGNRDTDELTYRKIGIPKGKIFIINPKGEVAINHQIDVKSYTSLHTLVNDMFPPTSMVEQEDFNSWNYWKMPVQDIDE